MFNKKRGLSDVITTLLIILLAIAAVAILWVFVGPALQGGGQILKSALECTDTKIEVSACKAVGNQISILNSAGSSYAVNIIVKNSNGVIKSATKSPVINALGSVSVVNTSPPTAVNDIVQVVPIITGADGKERVCEQQASATVRCT